MDRTLESWNNVVRTLSKVISSHPDKCLAVLSLSYHHLPNQLKACFLSMSSFPEDFQVETQRLIYLWIAEGFIRSSENGKSLEEVAMDYLEDLSSRNLIMVRKRRLNGEIKTCGIHDILREFCLIEAEMTKHMHVERIMVLVIFSKVLMFSSFPLVITKLFHLRYLQVPFHQNIPESISELQNLQTLICSGYSLESISLPVKIWTMQNLRYIRLWAATSLPSPRRESILNKHLVTRMPNLEEFSGLSCTSCTNEVFSGIPDLRRLIIQVPLLFDKYLPNEVMDISILRKLKAFKCYYWKHSWTMCISIKSSVFPTSLKRLTLSRCYLFPWEDISSTLIMLPNLEEFKLKDCKARDDIGR
ncbi:toMV susceptible protein tm-2-like [Solanum stenotomum]|uniref:toMV susceptible protein tm-2-like n=1 Tax=Solanum stenotomum TaxID=172797 RepID=UPI0020D0F863|nr:toMV susceptible protein tm-2-like [Solanum stenotomum]